MARVDPNQAAAAATGDPIPAVAGADPLGQPMIDMQNPVPGSTAPSAQDIATAEMLGLNPQSMGADEWDFVRVFQAGDLASIQPDGDPENPLIPGEGAPTEGVTVPPAIPAPTTQPTADAPPPATGAETGRAGEAPEGGAQDPTQAPAAAPSTTAPESIETPGRPAFQIPSTLPPPEPTVETPPEPQLQPNLVQLPDGSVVTLETYQRLLAAQQQAQPFAQQQPQPWNGPNPQAPPVMPPPQQYPLGQVPNAWSTTPGEYVDERAALEIESLRAQQQQMQAALALSLEQQQANSRQALDVAVEETKVGYAATRGLTPEQVDGLEKNAVRLGIVGVYAQMFPGDPRRAVAAALENVYWNTPEFRELEMQRTMETQREQNAEVERRRAFAAQTTGSPGSVPRAATPAAPGDTAAQMQGMVSMIEADPAFQQNQAQLRQSR